MNIAHQLLKHDNLFCSSREGVLKKLFYADLKMPDHMASHPHFLSDPKLLSKFGVKVPLGESLLEGCAPPSDSDAERKMTVRTLCPVPCYKKNGWFDRALDIDEHRAKRRKV